MSYPPYAPPAPLLIGYDPVCDLPPDHLARLVEAVVEEAITVPRHPYGPGNAPFDPRLPIKVLVYGYATGVRSSRRLEQSCGESLPYLFLTRGDTPSYRTLCRTRVEASQLIEQVWGSLFAVAGGAGGGGGGEDGGGAGPGAARATGRTRAAPPTSAALPPPPRRGLVP